MDTPVMIECTCACMPCSRAIFGTNAPARASPTDAPQPLTPPLWDASRISRLGAASVRPTLFVPTHAYSGMPPRLAHASRVGPDRLGRAAASTCRVVRHAVLLVLLPAPDQCHATPDQCHVAPDQCHAVHAVLLPAPGCTCRRPPFSASALSRRFGPGRTRIACVRACCRDRSRGRYHLLQFRQPHLAGALAALSLAALEAPRTARA
jgi:hypothetical protein